MKFLCLIVFCVIAVGSGCSADSAASNAPPAKAEAPSASTAFEGLIVAINASELRAPQNTFRIGGWNSNSSWIELKELAEDGAEVKEGDMIGRFDFRGQRALPQVKERIAKAEANRDNSSVSDSDTKALMSSKIEKSKLDAARAELDMLRGETVSKRDLTNFEIQKRLADFDAVANQKYAKAESRARFAEENYHEQAVQRAQADMDRFKMYKKRFTIVAPHDGVVRHAYHRRRARKVQKGDGMPAGMHFASVSRDASVAVEVYVPERYYQLAKSAKTFLVKSPTSDEAFSATVKSVDEFPQTIGFVKQDNRIPNAQDRVYVVHAVFDKMPKEMSSGLEVKVELP